jgi:hypothetical protein
MTKYLLISIVAILATACPSSAQPKKLIEFGWDEPDTEYMRQHITQMEHRPFDGCVFSVNFRTLARKGRLTWEAWGTTKIEPADIKEALADLQSTHFVKFKENFLRFNTTPAKLDWFDDYSAVLNNAKLAAQLARDGHCKGLLFDIEQYEGKLFKFSAQRDAKTKGFDAYAAQIRLRGKQVMEAFQEGYPDLTVFMSFGYSLPWATASHKPDKLAEADYGLLAPFMDGLVEGAKGKTRIIDGHELTYSYKDKSQFEAIYKDTKTGLLPIVANPDKYHHVASIGFGVWMDYDWRKKGWDIDHPEKNYFTPEAFEKSVKAALEVSDEYVWIYTETPRWWGKEGEKVKLPDAYEQALVRARQ